MKYSLTAALFSALVSGFGQHCLATETPLKLGEERKPPGEDQAITEFVKLQTDIMKATNPHLRGQHPKTHGCVEATFTVLPNIPSELKVGIFQDPKSYKALIRFSNGKSASDLERDVHGMAIKVSGVNGKKALPGDDSDAQDFILMDNEIFFASDAETLLGFMKARVEAQKNPEAIKTFAEKSEHNARTVALVQKSLKDKVPSPLAVPYWSTVPYKYGDRAVKFSVKPAKDNQVAMPQFSSENYLREAMIEHLTKQKKPATFDFYVQMRTDIETMPIEDPTVAWTSPEVKVATIQIAPQDFDTLERRKLCEGSSFSPWHALEVHAPLGGINRARRAVYETSSALRHQQTP
jgi:catalase